MLRSQERHNQSQSQLGALRAQLAAAQTEAAERAQQAQRAQQRVGAAEVELAQRAQQVQQLERIRQKNLSRIMELKQVTAFLIVVVEI